MKLIAVLSSALVCLAAYSQNDGPCGIPPEGKPQRIKGGESVPPLPLPATPLRRTERKREPSPPTLIAKIMWGETHVTKTESGKDYKWADWNLDPSDLQRLLKIANQNLGIKYRYVPMDLAAFSYDPLEIPILYITGKKGIRFTDQQRAKIRKYVLDGGYVWGDSCSGADAFTDAFRKEMAAIFPDYPLVRLPPDHPIYRCHNKIEEITIIQRDGKSVKSPPVLEGIYIGCRTGVIFTPADMSCGWDSSHVPHDAYAVEGNTAVRIGVNMIAYCLAYSDLGQFIRNRIAIQSTDENVKGDFVFAQVMYKGNWDPDPSAFSNVLKETISKSNVKVKLARKVLSLTDPALMSTPFIYITGHGEFVLSEPEVDALKKFISNGGTLLADACCGDLSFDTSFRREMKKVFGESELQRLTNEHPIFSSFHKIEAVQYSAQTLATFGEMNAPLLEGIMVKNELRIIYSRFGLGCGWEGADHPYSYMYSPQDALRLGVNIIVYVLTH